MDKQLLEILTNKPEIVSDFPDWMLSESTIEELKEIENLAIAEIAGRDSIAAAIEALRLRDLEAVLPTIAYTGTEYGRWEYPFEKTAFLEKRLEEQGVRVFPPVVLGSPRFWWTLCGRYATHLLETYGCYSPCIGCHLYVHALRIPLARMTGCRLIISGEREKHDERVKINQLGFVLDVYVDFLGNYGIELLLPLRHIQSGQAIEDIIGQWWVEGEKQLACVMSNNYQDSEGKVRYSREQIQQLLQNFAIKQTVDWVRGVLQKV